MKIYDYSISHMMVQGSCEYSGEYQISYNIFNTAPSYEQVHEIRFDSEGYLIVQDCQQKEVCYVIKKSQFSNLKTLYDVLNFKTLYDVWETQTALETIELKHKFREHRNEIVRQSHRRYDSDGSSNILW